MAFGEIHFAGFVSGMMSKVPGPVTVGVVTVFGNKW
jgi:hypothetical protein